MNYLHIASELFNTPWAIEESKFATIVELFDLRAAGRELTEEEIRARIAAGPGPQAGSKTAGAVAVIPIMGVINRRMNMMSEISGGTSIEKLTQQFRQALANPEVKSILLAVDSPGGGVYGLDELASEIFAARGQKKIVAQIDPLAASAAYYLASQADEVAITPSGDVGSVGVIAVRRDISKMQEQMGVKTEIVTYGKYKAEGNPTMPMSEEERANLQQRVNEYGEAFVRAVARGRAVKPADVREKFGQGRVVSAKVALEAGMVDRIATMDETLARMTNHGARAVVAAEAGEDAIAAKSSSQAGTATEAGAAEVQITATAVHQEVQQMPDTTTTTAAVAAELDALKAKAIEAETNRVRTIHTLAARHQMADQAAAWIQAGKTVEQVQAEILEKHVKGHVAVSQPAAEHVTVVRDEADKRDKGTLFAAQLRAAAGIKRLGQAGPEAAAAYAETVLRDKAAATQIRAAAQEASTVTGGGFMIGGSPIYEIVEMLRPLAVVRSLNPTVAPLVNGSINLAKITGGATAYYVGENKAIGASRITGGNVKGSARKLAVLVPISNDLLRWAPNADPMVRNDALRALKQVEDISFIRSAGNEYRPKGLRYWAANVLHAQAAPDLTKVTSDLNAMILKLEEADVPMANPGWIFIPRVKRYLMSLRDGNGNYAFKDEMIRGMLMGYPFRTTTQIPKTGLPAANETEIYFCEFSDVVICDAPGIIVETSSEASYVDSEGNTVSAFQNDQTLVKMIVEHDLIVRHAESVVVMDDCLWGS